VAEDPHLDYIDAYMAKRWPKAERLTAYVRDLWADYSQIDIDDRDHVISQLVNDDDEQFWQRLWELQLGSHLFRLGHKTHSPKKGPDFRFEADGITIWVEAISPGPRDIPAAWLGFARGGEGTIYNAANGEMLLRWTSAFRSKRARFKDYEAEGIIAPGEACVIAVNGGQLSNFWPTPYGISQKPWCVEVVFPVGPLQAEFLPGSDDARWNHSVRHEVFNRNAKPVMLYPFITPECSAISALVSCDVGCSPDMSLPLYVAHNPLANVPLPLGVLGEIAEEWQAVQLDGLPGEFSLSRVR
jgi:hypothetical protein